MKTEQELKETNERVEKIFAELGFKRGILVGITAQGTLETHRVHVTWAEFIGIAAITQQRGLHYSFHELSYTKPPPPPAKATKTRKAKR